MITRAQETLKTELRLKRYSYRKIYIITEKKLYAGFILIVKTHVKYILELNNLIYICKYEINLVTFYLSSFYINYTINYLTSK